MSNYSAYNLWKELCQSKKGSKEGSTRSNSIYPEMSAKCFLISSRCVISRRLSAFGSEEEKSERRRQVREQIRRFVERVAVTRGEKQPSRRTFPTTIDLDYATNRSAKARS